MAYNPSNPNGQATMANSEPVVIASDQTAIPVNDNGGSLTIDGSVSVSNFPATQPVSGTITANAGTGTMNVSVQNASVPIDAILVKGTSISSNAGGTDDGCIRVVLPTDQTSIPITDNGGSLTIDGSVTASDTTGNVAHDAADSGNPVKIGFQAENVLSNPVANGDRANAVSDLFGRQLVSHIDAGMQVWKSANYTTQQTGASMWTPSSGKKICVTYLSVASYGTTAGRVIIWFGASADTTYTAGTDQLVWAGSFAPSTSANPGAIIQLPFGINAVTADHQLRITTDAAISLDLTIYGYEC